MVFGSGKTLYKPGEVVPEAGIYKVLHNRHREAHEVSLKADQTFPSCKKCGAQVRFELVLSAEKTE